MNKKGASQKSRTYQKRLKAMADKDIDLSDNPELTPGMFAREVARPALRPVARKV